MTRTEVSNKITKKGKQKELEKKLKYLHMKAQFIVSSNSSYGERGKKKNRVTQVAIVLDRVSSPRVKGNMSYLHLKL